MTLDFEKESVVFTNEMGELVERLAMRIQGHDVQVIRFDGNDERLLVKVDTSVNILPLGQVSGFIKARLV